MMTPGGPGWNDPPSLSYETHTQTTSRRNLLTKRVGLPSLTLPSESAVSSYLNKDSPPPTEKKQLLPPPKMKFKTTLQTEDVSIPSDRPRATEKSLVFLNPATISTDGESLAEPSSGEEQAVSHMSAAEGVTILNPSGKMDKDGETDCVKKAEDDLKECDIESVNVDIATDLKNLAEYCYRHKVITDQVKITVIKKIAILEKQINENKLPDPVLKKVETLTKFLVLKKYDNAWDVHLSLVCDHSSSVMQWIVGVKKLISEAKNLG